MFSSLLTISHKVRTCTGRGGVKCFFCLMAVKDVGAGGFAAGPGYLRCLILLFVWIDSMVWPCALRVMFVSVIWPLGRGKAMRGGGDCPCVFVTTL